MKYKYSTKCKQFLADVLSPVQSYFNLRDHYPNSILLESSDYNSIQNSRSIICCEPLSDFVLKEGVLSISNGSRHTQIPYSETQLYEQLNSFIDSFEVENSKTVNGIFGYLSYDSIPYFETIDFQASKENAQDIPEARYHFYRFIAVFNHFTNELIIQENIPEGEESQLENFESKVLSRNFQTFPFSTEGEIESSFTDEDFLEMVEKGKYHCRRGDVFQIVLSRQFKQKYKGDEFTLYRALRSINPSPYLYYFDYGDYKVLGSSPEAQIIIAEGNAEIHPIAGTFKKTGNDLQDSQLAEQLLEDPKEVAEHTMLVDLARNDLSRNCEDVHVSRLKEIQYFSHVIHMVSRVEGTVENAQNNIKTMMDSFPAGTLSGAPKYRAMQLIDTYEKQKRGLYAGAIGFIDFQKNINHAIVIRSFIAKDKELYFQAGAGIVDASIPENENKEVYNKLNALTQSIDLAKTLN